MKHFFTLLILLTIAIQLPAQCWYFDDSGDELCITDPDGCTQAYYPDNTVPQFIEALTINPNNPGQVWAADDGIVGTLDVDPASPTYAQFTPLSAAPYHDTGYDIDGLGYDASANCLWASLRVVGNDSIVKIDLGTGEVIGSPIVTAAPDIDELTFAPPGCGISGMYASIYDGSQWRLGIINTATGAVTYVGTGFGISDAESLTFSGNCELIVNTGPGVAYCVNISTGAVIAPAKIDLQGADVEGMSCEAASGMFITLPVDLVSFDVEKLTKNRVLVTWETASELSSDHFVVERSTTGSNSTFTPIGRITAAGHSTSIQTYEFEDALLALNGETAYYRLRSIDLDGSDQLSVMKSVPIENQIQSGLLAYPNPASSYLNVNMGSAQRGQVALINTYGKVMMTRTVDNQFSELSVSHLPDGNYILRIEGENGKLDIQKVLILK